MENSANVSISSGSSSGISNKNDMNDNMDNKWEIMLNSPDGKESSWKIEVKPTGNNGKSDAISGIDGIKESNMPPEVKRVLDNFIGNMGIEMVKTQNPAQKISMDDEDK